jgi:hypothetical protein
LRPQNVVRFYEKALKAQRSIVNLEKDNLDPVRSLEYEFVERLCQTLLKFYIGLQYLNDKAFREALLVLNRVSNEVESTIDFARKSNLHQQSRIKRDIEELLVGEIMKSLQGLLCKCQAKVFIENGQRHKIAREELTKMEVDTEQQKNHTAKVDSLYDILFDHEGRPKSNESLQNKFLISGNRLDFLETSATNLSFLETDKSIEIDKLKISKTFKLVNPVPKF